ncbi:histidine phosphatase family protein [Demetria terragena]|uniref:histidine phosphatase family protein n=1 Tax=Demetria terragena TaxID=63959 RepID=UPI0003779291|nr:histidine phosphatase family protein [Demetria terragena]
MVTRSVRTSVHVVRHGEVDNPGRVLYGRLPGYHLSPRGHEMARIAADYLAPHDITHLVSSPLERAQETIAPLAAHLELTPHLDERVIEAGNSFEGSTIGSRPQQLAHPRYWRRLINPLQPSWGEPYAEIVQRMAAAIRDARTAAYGHEAVIVSHQLPIWTIRQAAEGHRLAHDPRRRQCSLASVTTFVFADDDLDALEYAEPAARLLTGEGVAGA